MAANDVVMAELTKMFKDLNEASAEEQKYTKIIAQSVVDAAQELIPQLVRPSPRFFHGVGLIYNGMVMLRQELNLRMKILALTMRECVAVVKAAQDASGALSVEEIQDFANKTLKVEIEPPEEETMN